MAGAGKTLNGASLPPSVNASPWSPLREPLFRTLWIAAVVSYTGTWMQNVGAGWLMTSLTMDPFMVGLVQAASSLPVFLVILPAGALADIVDRRRLLIVTQSWMVIAAAALGILAITTLITPWVLLAFTFVLGLGASMNDPAWQAITPEVVSGERFAQAVALNSAGFNVARAVGPALGGLVIAAGSSSVALLTAAGIDIPCAVNPAAAGSGVTFLLNALSFAGVIFFLYRWKRPRQESPRSGERMMSAIKVGFDYLRGSDDVRCVLVRTALFSLPGSALLAMLPIVARPFGSVGYGSLLGFFGLGALGGAAVLPRFRQAMSVNRVFFGATVVFAAATAAAGYFNHFLLLCLVLFLAGLGWIAILAILNVSAQTMSPSWVRARTLSIYLLVLQGGMSFGSAAWGAVAGRVGVPATMAGAALVLAVGLITIGRYRLRADGYDFSPVVASEP